MGTLFNFIIITLVATVIINDASANSCPLWTKLNKSPVCFGARDNQYGKFTYSRNIFVSSFMVVHRTGSVTCNKKGYSYWGCGPNASGLGQITQTNYWPLSLPVVVDGTVWQVTPLRLLFSCSVLPRSPTVSSLTPSSACGTEKIYVALQRAITAAKLAQMCMVCWLKLFPVINLEH